VHITGIKWVEARDAAQTIYRIVTTTKNDPSPNFNPNIIKAGSKGKEFFFKTTINSTYLNNKYLLNAQ